MDSIVVTGANGLVGSAICRALSERAAEIRAVVRRAGTAPAHPGVQEHVGDFTDPSFAADVVAGSGAVITTAHPLGADRATQARVAVDGTTGVARAAAQAGVSRLIHISTAAVYDRSPGAGDVDESSALVGDDGGDYAVAKRDTDHALESVAGITRVILRPPAILGPGPTSVWNTVRPNEMREDEAARHAVAAKTFAWVHVRDLAALAADLGTGQITAETPDGYTVANVASGPATVGDYHGTVTRALGVEAIYDDEPAWTGQILAGPAHAWGWRPTVTLADALAEITAGLTE